jgi:hypothetical protein
MKKKFINGFLMVAMLFATTSSFVSCKDNVDDDLSDVYNNLGKKSSELQDKINSVQNDLQNQINNIKPLIIEYGDTVIQNITENITQIIQFNVDSICNDYNTKIENINQDLEIINQQITNQTLAIDSINNALNYIDNRINNVGDSVNILWARVDSIVGILDALVDGDLITSVRVETTRNDVLGIINTPIAKVNALAAYYGTNDSGIEEFPYSGYDFNVGGNRFAEWLEDYELPDAGYVKLDESDYITDAYANAGQIYFTVNSTNYKNFDISKITKIQIENSAGEVAPIQLNVRKSTARINWDFGRAFLEETGVDPKNGLHVADATIKEEDLDPTRFQIEKFINFEKLKSEIRKRIDDIRNVEGESSDQTASTVDKAKFKNFVREIASLAYGILKNDLTQSDLASNITYSPQRMAFFVEKGGEMTRIAQTDIDILTTSVKPLSYNSFWEYENNKKDNWIIETVLEKVISRIAKEINERWGDAGVKAKIVKLDEENKTVYIKLNGNTEKIVVKNTEYWSDLKKALNVNGGLDAVNDKLAKLLKTYTLGTVVNKAENRINEYLTKASDYLTNLIHKHLFTRAVAPIIIFETSTGVDRLCEGMFIKRGVMHAYLTSGTMELLVPAYRKYVAVEKNGMLLESAVLPGNTLTHDFDLNEKGDYKIIISCVDYFGYVVTKKYNVYVK